MHHRLSKDAVLALCVNIWPYVQIAVRSIAIPFELNAKYDQIKNQLSILSKYRLRLGLHCECFKTSFFHLYSHGM